MINPKLDNVNITNCISDDEGCKVLLNINMEDKNYTLVHVYAPNDENYRKQFFKSLIPWINENACNKENIILGGDFNCSLENNDRSSKTHLNDKSRIEMKHMLQKINLEDVWQSKANKLSNHYTWNDKSTYSRLDYLFCSKLTSLNIEKIQTSIVVNDTSGMRSTDHKAVVMTATINAPPRGPGYYKLNVQILKDENYCKGIQNLFQLRNEDNMLSNCNDIEKWEILKEKS